MPDQDMLINVVPDEACRIAIVENGHLEEYYIERTGDDLHVGNIYRGKVTNVEPAIQAAFVDFGLERNGFLHISDLHPRYFSGEDNGGTERVGKKTPRRERPPIQQCLKRGQEILVQVLKEGIGTKGPTLTTYLSVPGRFLVMLPYMERHGVSRKVEDEDARRQMRQILDEVDPPKDFGFIVRTAGIGHTKTELKRDLVFLQRLWRTIASRMHQGAGPTELYTESDLVIRTIRDVLGNQVQRIIVDDLASAQRARDFLTLAMPRGSVKVIHYRQTVPLFDAFGVEKQIQGIHENKVPLECGGSLVIDSTEALVAVDVNSGTFRKNMDAEQTAYRTNLEAVDEIARQLRLRDLGGVVILDLIDMYVPRHRREIEQRLRDNLKEDRARTKALRISEFGIVQLTRQRMRPSVKVSDSHLCATCSGTGTVRRPEAVVADAMRACAAALSRPTARSVRLFVSPDVGGQLLNRYRHSLAELEKRTGKRIEVQFDEKLGPEGIRAVAVNAQQVEMDAQPSFKPPTFTDDDEVRSGRPSQPAVSDADSSTDDQTADAEATSDDAGAEAAPTEATRTRRRRRRRRSKRTTPAEPAEPDAAPPAEPPAESAAEDQTTEETAAPSPSRRRRRRSRKKKTAATDESTTPDTPPAPTADAAPSTEPDSEAKPPSRRRRTRRGGRRKSRSAPAADQDAS